MAQHLLAEVIHAVLVVRESVFAGAVCELRVQVEQTVLLVVERNRERPVVGKASRAVGADSPFGPPPASAPGAPCATTLPPSPILYWDSISYGPGIK